MKNVLHIDDDPDDAFLVQHSFAKKGMPVLWHTVPNGKEGIDYLAGVGRYSDRTCFPLPDLVLLDLKMPVVNGFEVLDWMRRHPCCQSLPIFILSSSSQEEDRKQAARLGATDYVVKEPGFDELVEKLVTWIQE